jgi:glyoxylase-like metal-dependent hydrolase (beta-lactamase superfamily II)
MVTRRAALVARPRPYTSRVSDWVHVIPLGGLGEVGKNMTAFEADGSIVVVDAGLAFPRDEHLGVDLVLPDFTYLRERRDAIRGVVLTHGHEDHVGALPYLLREVGAPEVWATRLTLGLIKSKLDEHGLLRTADLHEVDPDGRPVELGPFRLEFVRMAHSIPDAVAVVLETPGGRVVVTGDYKLDHTPVDGLRTTSAGSPRSATGASTSCSATRRTPSGRATRRRSGSSARRSGRSSRTAPAGSSSRRSRRTSTACSRRSTSPCSAAARCASSAARCARTSTSRATSATSTCPRGR